MTTQLDIIAQRQYAREEGLAEGRLDTLRELVADGLVTIDALKERYSLSEEEIAAIQACPVSD